MMMMMMSRGIASITGANELFFAAAANACHARRWGDDGVRQSEGEEGEDGLPGSLLVKVIQQNEWKRKGSAMTVTVSIWRRKAKQLLFLNLQVRPRSYIAPERFQCKLRGASHKSPLQVIMAVLTQGGTISIQEAVEPSSNFRWFRMLF